MKFIRYGSLQPQSQVNYGNDTFHAPPCKKGFYAFPFKYVEFFLLGATSDPSNSSGKSYWLRDDDGNKILDNDIWDFDEYNKRTGEYEIKKEYKPLLKKKNIKRSMLRTTHGDDSLNGCYVVVLKKPKEYEYVGEIWHHLVESIGNKRHLILDEVGSWIKTDMKTYEYCLKRNAHIQHRDQRREWGVEFSRNKDGNKVYCKDHLEVFFERVK